MTAPAAALVSATVAAPTLRAAPQAVTDRFSFGAMLDSLPGATAKAGSAVAGERSQTSNETTQEQSPSGPSDSHPTLGDGAFLLSLPFTLQSGLAAGQGPAAGVDAPPLASAATKGARLETSGASGGATVNQAKPAVARLTGERAFHLAPSTSGAVSASPSPIAGATVIDAPSFAPALTAVREQEPRARVVGSRAALDAGSAADACRTALAVLDCRREPLARRDDARRRRRAGDKPGVSAGRSSRSRRLGKSVREPETSGAAGSGPRRAEGRSRCVAVLRKGCESGSAFRQSRAGRQGRRASARSSRPRRTAGDASKHIWSAAVGVRRPAVIRTLRGFRGGRCSPWRKRAYPRSPDARDGADQGDRRRPLARWA